VLRIAVPDFAKVAAGYLEGAPQPTEGWVMGGQTDPDDFHRSIFDADKLKRLLSDAGLVLLRPWDIRDRRLRRLSDVAEHGGLEAVRSE
jgi:hypothetical protein